jgi:hypothetical protein
LRRQLAAELGDVVEQQLELGLERTEDALGVALKT